MATKKLTKEEQYRTLKNLADVARARAEVEKEYKRLREIVDGWTGKQTTSFGYYDDTLTAVYENTTDTRTDYKGLFEEFGITEADKERHTTHTPSTRFKAVI